MSRRFARQIAALVLAVWWLNGPRPIAAQPTLSHVTPHAVAPGKTTEITIHGTKLDGALRVWTSFAAQVEVPAASQKSDGNTAACRISLHSNAPLGIGGIAVATADGVSEVAYVMIDDLPSVADGGDNHTTSNPQQISLPVAIDGQSDGTLADYYHFSAKVGERISGEIVAARLGWDFDSLIRVLDRAGNELLIADDDAATGADARFVFTAPRDGEYLLEVRDNRYKPGGRYRLRLGDFPLVSTTLPLFVQRGIPGEIAFRGTHTESVQPLTILPVGDSRVSEFVNLSAHQRVGHSSGWAMLGISDLPIALENGNAKEPASLTIPGIACGAFSAPRERDLFKFTATKGVPLRLRAISRSLGSAAILSLRVLDASGKQLSESPVTDSDEPALSFTPPADGRYKLAVEELAIRGGTDYTYAVESTSGPQFSLVLKNDKNNRLRHSLPAGGAFYLDVQAQRSGYDGPIALAIDSERPGWQVFNNVIVAKANEARMYIQPPLDLSAGELADLRIIGKATAADREIKAAMTTTVQLRAARPQMPYPPRWHDGAIFVSGQGVKPMFFSVANKSDRVDIHRSGGQAKIELDFERLNPKFKDVPLTVVPVALPAGITVEFKRNGNGPKETYDINLKLPKNLGEGQYTFRYFAYAEMGGQGRGFLSGDIRLNVLPDEKSAASAEAKTP